MYQLSIYLFKAFIAFIENMINATSLINATAIAMKFIELQKYKPFKITTSKLY